MGLSRGLARDPLGLNGSVGWRHNFTARLLANLGYQYSRSVVQIRPFFENRENVSGEAGISGNNQDPMNWGPPDLIFSGGITSLSDGRPSSRHNQTSAVSYAMNWNRGRHGISFGADFRRQQFNYLSQQNPRGTYTFTGTATQTLANGLPVPGTGNDFADFLLGTPTTSAIAFGNADKYFRASSYDAYWTDDFRISPGVTMYAGLRWEYGSPITELYGRLVNLDTKSSPDSLEKELGSIESSILPLTQQTPYTLLMMRVVEIGLPLLLSIFSIFFVLRYTLTEKRSHEIKDLLKKRTLNTEQ